MTMLCHCRHGYFLFILALVGSCFSTTCLALSSSFSMQKTTRNVATQILQGAGPATVDMNQYNLDSLDTIKQEWTANLVQKSTENKATTRLGVRNDQELFVNVVTVEFPRKVAKSGLGIMLEDLVEGREDGLGITLVSGLVEGGMAFGTDILPGDAVSQVAVVRTSQQDGAAGVSQVQQEFVAKTECLSYDATVDAISKLPPPPPPSSNSVDTFQLKLKRIRRKPKCTIKLQYPPSQKEPDATIELFAGENLRQAMLVRGVRLNDELAKRFDTKSGGNCGAGGLCRTCAVSVLRGKELLNPQRPAEQQMLADSPRWRLACKAIVGFGMQQGEMTIRVNPRQW